MAIFKRRADIGVERDVMRNNAGPPKHGMADTLQDHLTGFVNRTREQSSLKAVSHRVGVVVFTHLFKIPDQIGDNRDLRIPLCSIAPSGELPFITGDELGSMTFDIGVSTKDTSTPQIIIAGQDIV